ncbi:unnamed protein product [Malus baccata var. baccata]
MGLRARAAGALPNLIRTLRKEAHNPIVTPISQAHLLSLRSYQSHQQHPQRPASFSIFQLVQPIPCKFQTSILILACGRNIEPVDPELICYICSTGMKLEANDSVYFIRVSV